MVKTDETAIDNGRFISLDGIKYFRKINEIYIPLKRIVFKNETDINNSNMEIYQEETAKAIIDFVYNKLDEESLTVYTPMVSYIGLYGYNYIVDEFESEKPHNGNDPLGSSRVNDWVQNGILYLAGALLAGPVSIILSILPISGPGISEGSNKFADMREIKYVKKTYVNMGDAYLFGGHTEKTSVKFYVRELPVGAEPRYIYSTSWIDRNTGSYYSNEQHAVEHADMGGHYERITQHKFENIVYESQWK